MTYALALTGIAFTGLLGIICAGPAFPMVSRAVAGRTTMELQGRKAVTSTRTDEFLPAKRGDFQMGYGFGSIVGLLILIADIWAIVQILQGGGAPGRKLLWVLVILILPVLGLLIWLIAGRR